MAKSDPTIVILLFFTKVQSKIPDTLCMNSQKERKERGQASAYLMNWSDFEEKSRYKMMTSRYRLTLKRNKSEKNLKIYFSIFFCIFAIARIKVILTVKGTSLCVNTSKSFPCFGFDEKKIQFYFPTKFSDKILQ